MTATLRRFALPAGPLLAAALYLWMSADGEPHALAATVGLTAWCALWWVLEPVPAPVTALLPLAALPVLGVLDAKQVAQSYGHELILLLGGGFMLSRALERSGAHRDLAADFALNRPIDRRRRPQPNSPLSQLFLSAEGLAPGPELDRSTIGMPIPSA